MIICTNAFPLTVLSAYNVLLAHISRLPFLDTFLDGSLSWRAPPSFTSDHVMKILQCIMPWMLNLNLAVIFHRSTVHWSFNICMHLFFIFMAMFHSGTKSYLCFLLSVSHICLFHSFHCFYSCLEVLHIWIIVTISKLCFPSPSCKYSNLSST